MCKENVLPVGIVVLASGTSTHHHGDNISSAVIAIAIAIATSCSYYALIIRVPLLYLLHCMILL